MSIGLTVLQDETVGGVSVLAPATGPQVGVSSEDWTDMCLGRYQSIPISFPKQLFPFIFYSPRYVSMYCHLLYTKLPIKVLHCKELLHSKSPFAIVFVETCRKQQLRVVPACIRSTQKSPRGTGLLYVAR